MVIFWCGVVGGKRVVMRVVKRKGWKYVLEIIKRVRKVLKDIFGV